MTQPTFSALVPQGSMRGFLEHRTGALDIQHWTLQLSFVVKLRWKLKITNSEKYHHCKFRAGSCIESNQPAHHCSDQKHFLSTHLAEISHPLEKDIQGQGAKKNKVCRCSFHANVWPRVAPGPRELVSLARFGTQKRPCMNSDRDHYME